MVQLNSRWINYKKNRSIQLNLTKLRPNNKSRLKNNKYTIKNLRIVIRNNLQKRITVLKLMSITIHIITMMNYWMNMKMMFSTPIQDGITVSQYKNSKILNKILRSQKVHINILRTRGKIFNPPINPPHLQGMLILSMFHLIKEKVLLKIRGHKINKRFRMNCTIIEKMSPIKLHKNRNLCLFN